MKTLRIGDVYMAETYDGVEVVKVGRERFNTKDCAVDGHGSPRDEEKITIKKEDRNAFADFLKGVE